MNRKYKVGDWVWIELCDSYRTFGKIISIRDNIYDIDAGEVKLGVYKTDITGLYKGDKK